MGSDFVYFLILLFPISLFLTFFATNNNILIEKYYSQGIYLIINKLLYLPSNLFHFSLGEILLYLFIFLSVLFTIRFIYRNYWKRSYRKAIKNPGTFSKKTALIRGLLNIVICFSILYFIFIINWGLNYHRL